MKRLTRAKRRVLREAVAENLATMNGQYGVTPERRPSRWRTVTRNLLLVSLPAALFASSYVYSLGIDARVPATAALDGGQRQGTTGPSLVARTFQPPEPLDPAAIPLPVRTVVLDPGHGGLNKGTEGPFGLVEKEVTLDIARRLQELLDKARFRVVMTRAEDRSVSLDERARLANDAGGDIFVSIHVNWLEDRGARGIETYFLGATDDPFLTQLAATENVDSGYSLAAFRKILEGVYEDVRQQESRRLARAIHRELYSFVRDVSPAIGDRGVKKAPFIVLIGTEMPAVLAEVSCLSNPEEARLLMEPSYRQYIALALYSGIRAYSDNVYRSNLTGASG